MRSLRPDDLDVLALEQLVVGQVDDPLERLPTASALEVAVHHTDVAVPGGCGAGVAPTRVRQCVDPVHDHWQGWGTKKRLSEAGVEVNLQDSVGVVAAVVLAGGWKWMRKSVATERRPSVRGH